MDWPGTLRIISQLSSITPGSKHCEALGTENMHGVMQFHVGLAPHVAYSAHTHEMGTIHLFQEIAILEFPTSDCFQNEAICDNKPTAAAGPVGNTRWRPVWRNKLLVLAMGPCWLKNYNCPTIQITGQNRLK